jgi:hypothetical protein
MAGGRTELDDLGFYHERAAFLSGWSEEFRLDVGRYARGWGKTGGC